MKPGNVRRMFKLWKVLLFIMFVGCGSAFPVFESKQMQCILCRAEREHSTILGGRFETAIHEENDFTQWYTEHRPPHSHVWRCADRSISERNFLGMPMTLRVIMRYPVLILSREEELTFVQKQENQVLDQFFRDVASMNYMTARGAFEQARSWKDVAP
jgi:hypothetical protein